MQKKYVFILLFLSNILFSKEVHFNETKYIYALDNKFSKVGTLNIEDAKVTLHYKNSDKKVIYTDENIQIITSNTTEIYTHEESLEYNIFFQLVLGIYTNNTSQLGENFTLKQDKNLVTLIPNEYLSSVIETIEYEKNNNTLKFLKINFTNQDRITIEETK